MTLTDYTYKDYVNDSAYCSNCKGVTLLNTKLLPNMKAKITCRYCNETEMCYVGCGKNGKPSFIPIKSLGIEKSCSSCCAEYFDINDDICPLCDIETKSLNLEYNGVDYGIKLIMDKIEDKSKFLEKYKAGSNKKIEIIKSELKSLRNSLTILDQDEIKVSLRLSKEQVAKVTSALYINLFLENSIPSDEDVDLYEKLQKASYIVLED